MAAYAEPERGDAPGVRESGPAPRARRASSPPLTVAPRPRPLARPAPPRARAQPAGPLRAPLMWPPGGYPDPWPRPGSRPLARWPARPLAGLSARPPASSDSGWLVSSGCPAHPPSRIPARASSAHRSVSPGPRQGSSSRSLQTGMKPRTWESFVERFWEAKGRGGDVRAARHALLATGRVRAKCTTLPS